MKTHPLPSAPRRKALGVHLILACLGLLAPIAGPTSARAESGTINGDTADGQVNSDGTVTADTATYGRIGADAGLRHSVVHVFQIPSSIVNDPSQQFSTASYSVKLGGGSAMTKNSDLYALGYDTTPTLMASDFYEGALDNGEGILRLQDNFITPSTTAYATLTHNSPGFVAYLNGVLAAARADSETTAYAFLRHSLDDYVWSGIYTVGMKEAGGAYIPKLTYETETVFNWRSVPLGGGGYVTGLASDPTGSAIYCRTDVGGVFRWIPTGDTQGNGSWKPLNDAMVPFGTEKAAALLCVESIAVDPNTPNRLYISVGNHLLSSSRRGIYGSDNLGQDWYLVPGSDTFPIKGNGTAGRSAGERLVVDPNNSNILWCGSVSTGLRKFVKGSGGWTVTQIAATEVPYGTDPFGITFVACDKNGSGPTILYAGVSHATTGGIYRSTDGGVDWTPVGGAALRTPKRGQVAANGTLYVTGGTGGVAKLPRAGSLSLISALPTTHPTHSPALPVSYRGLAVDPSDAAGNKVYLSGAALDSSGGENAPLVLRSDDGGASWDIQNTTFNEGPRTMTNQVRKEPDGTLSMTGYWFGNVSSLLVNPADPSELWLGDFFGVSRTRNAQDIGANPGAWWHTLQKNQEETVVFAAKNAPTGVPLLTGVADVGGARYTNTTSRPYDAGGSRFGNPKAGNTTSLDFSELNPAVWARATTSPNHGTGSGAVSIDEGLNWATFGQVDARVIAMNSVGGWETFDIGPYLRAQQLANKQAVTLVIRANTDMAANAVLEFASDQTENSPKVAINGGTPEDVAEDAFVDGNATGTNYQNDDRLRVQGYFGQTTGQKWSYLKINIAGKPPITSATLQLYRLPSNNSHSVQTMVYTTPDVLWTEGGITWNNRPTSFVTVPAVLSNKGGGRVAVSATNPANLVWVAIKDPAIPGTTTLPAYYSKDRGVTWTASTGGPDSQIKGVYTNGTWIDAGGQPLAADRGNGKFYYASFGNTAHTIYRSDDQGASWAVASTRSNGGTDNKRTCQLVAAPVSTECPGGGDVWLCDDNSVKVPATPTAGGLWRSKDSAGSWTAVPSVTKVTAIGFGKGEAPGDYTVFVYGYKDGVKGVYRSDNYGTSWTKLADPTLARVFSLSGDRQNFGKAFLGTEGRGVFIGQ